jgi:hypothetical protein
MRDNVDVLPYDDHDKAIKLLHALDRTMWDGKVEAILESEKYTTLMLIELLSKLKSAEVDRGLTAHLESPTGSLSLALVGGKVTSTPVLPTLPRARVAVKMQVIGARTRWLPRT